jgi:hypothetical protein
MTIFVILFETTKFIFNWYEMEKNQKLNSEFNHSKTSYSSKDLIFKKIDDWIEWERR